MATASTAMNLCDYSVENKQVNVWHFRLGNVLGNNRGLLAGVWAGVISSPAVSVDRARCSFFISAKLHGRGSFCGKPLTAKRTEAVLLGFSSVLPLLPVYAATLSRARPTFSLGNFPGLAWAPTIRPFAAFFSSGSSAFVIATKNPLTHLVQRHRIAARKQKRPAHRLRFRRARLTNATFGGGHDG